MEVPGRIIARDQLQSLKYGSEDDIKLHCQPCDRDGPRVQAYGYCQDCSEHLCETCYRTHRKSVPFRDHVLVYKTRMPKFPSLSQYKTADDLTEQCQQHEGRLVEYFCHDHKTLGCSPCITIGHSNCNVDFIPDVSANFVRSPEYQLFCDSIKTLQDNLQQIINQAKANEKELLKNKFTIKNDIQKCRQEINRKFDILETQLLKRTDDLLAAESARIHSIATASVKMLDDIGILQRDIKKLEDVYKNNAVYIKAMSNDDSVKSCNSAMSKMKKKNFAATYMFEPDMAIRKMLVFETRIGLLLPEKQTISLKQMLFAADILKKGELYENLIATPVGQIDTEIKTDKNQGSLGGIVATTDSIVAIDSKNSSVKLVDTTQKKVVSSKNFTSPPDGLAVLPGEQVAITISAEQRILFLSIPNELSEVHSLTVDGRCCDIAYCDGKLVVCFEFPGEICIMDEKGHVYQSTKKDFLGKRFQRPMVTVDSINKYIYVSDWYLQTVTCFSSCLKGVNCYKADRPFNPHGMVTLKDGSILVCSPHDKITSVYAIAPNLKESRELLGPEAGLTAAWSLAVDTEHCMLYVVYGVLCKFVKMFDLKIRK